MQVKVCESSSLLSEVNWTEDDEW